MIPVPVPIINDMIVEGNETFFGLLDAQGQPVIVDPPREQAMVLITEDPSDGIIIYWVTWLCGLPCCVSCMHVYSKLVSAPCAICVRAALGHAMDIILC